MKSKQLLSVVFSLILVMGVSAGSAFAQTDDDLDDSSMDDDSSEYETGTERDEHEDELDEYEAEHDDKDEYEHNREYKDGKEYDLDDRLEFFCSMTDLQKRQLFADHPRLEQFKHRLVEFCDLGGDARENAIDNFIMEHFADVEHDYDHREILDRYCAMSDEDKRVYVAKHDKASDKVEKMNRYCTLDEDMKRDFIIEHRDEYISHMKDKAKDHMKYKVKAHMKDRFSTMEFDRFCAMTDAELSAATFEMEFVERASKWCDMSPDERKASMKEHIRDMVHDKVSDAAPRLKAMIMADSVSDEKKMELKAKFMEKFGEKADKLKSELKMKYKDHVDKVKSKISDERKSAIFDRLAEMKVFKAELRANSDLSVEEKQLLRADFIEKAKDMQLAWITPRAQMNAGVDISEIECREGYSLVMKASSGVAICLKADTALKMIDRGIAVPAN